MLLPASIDRPKILHTMVLVSMVLLFLLTEILAPLKVRNMVLHLIRANTVQHCLLPPPCLLAGPLSGIQLDSDGLILNFPITKLSGISLPFLHSLNTVITVLAASMMVTVSKVDLMEVMTNMEQDMVATTTPWRKRKKMIRRS